MEYINQSKMSYLLISVRKCKHCGETNKNEVWVEDSTGDEYIECANHECRMIERWV